MPKSFTRWLRSLVGSASAPPPQAPQEATLEARLVDLERQADQGQSGLAGIPLNRAGDACYKAGDRQRALEYYGRAIDAFLEEHHPESARAVAQKIIRLHPRAVRTLCTLTWLDLGTGHRADAPDHLRAYVAAAERSGDEVLAADQVLEMARTVEDTIFRAAASEALERLGFPSDAARVRSWLDGDGEAPVEVPAEDLPERCFMAAVRSNSRRRGGEAA